MLNLKKVSVQKLNEIIDNRRPLGYFYTKTENHKFVGVDNQSGNAWTEDFETIEEVENYFKY